MKMHRSLIVVQQRVVGARFYKSLALSVYFKQPDFGMKDYEILSRATAFLLNIDRSKKTEAKTGPFAHLEESEQLREEKKFRQKRKYSRPNMEGREVKDLGWLEFVPKEARPQVHIVTSSHVLAPFLWRNYYPQDWLKHVTADHCTYSVEVFDSIKPLEPLAKLALNKEVFHHPEGRDIALIHFQDEAESLKLLQSLGVDTLNLREPQKMFRKGEMMFFDGFVVSEANAADKQNIEEAPEQDDEDRRIFYPYTEEGTLSFHTDDRFFAATNEPLPEGLCGAPVLDDDGDMCGCVEGIVPLTHEDKRIAGNAAFMPSHVMRAFIDSVERGLLEKIMPDSLFRRVVETKETNNLSSPQMDKSLVDAYEKTLSELKEKYTQQEIEAIEKLLEQERKEVMDIFNKEGGDLDNIAEKVRQKTLQIRAMVIDQFKKEQEKKGDGV